MATMLDAARRYLELGYHPIPCRPRSKVPMVQWERFQKLPPTTGELEKWFTDTPDANIALVLGRGTFALDLDGGDDALALVPQDIADSLPMCPKSLTGSGGYHLLFSGYCGDRVALWSTEGHKPQVDVRGKGIIVAPPSIHPNGQPYKWLTKPGKASELPPAPPRLVALIAQAPEPGTTQTQAPTTGVSWVTQSMMGVPEGQRDATCARLAGYFLEKGIPVDVTETLLLETFARKCVPPFPDRDVHKTVASIARREATAGSDVERELTPVHISRVLIDLMASMDSGPAKVTATPYPGLNRFLTGGFAPGELIYLGARPGVGKTALALEIARQAAKHGPVLVVSREMVNVSLARRMVAQDAKVRSSVLKQVTLSQTEYEAFQGSYVRLGSLDLWLTDEAVSLSEIAELTRQAPGGRAWELVIVDYLQMVRAPRDVKDRRLQVEAVSQGLKTLALQFKVPVLCLSSLSRPPQGNPRPTLASLRESGELEHDADVVMFLHKDNDDATEVECNVCKNRDGGLGRVYLTFTPEYVAFAESENQHANG